MANLQVKDIDDNLYNALKSLSKKKRRSVSQELIRIIEAHLSKPTINQLDATEMFLNLSWDSDESADDLIKNVIKNRNQSERFPGLGNVFD